VGTLFSAHQFLVVIYCKGFMIEECFTVMFSVDFAGKHCSEVDIFVKMPAAYQRK